MAKQGKANTAGTPTKSAAGKQTDNKPGNTKNQKPKKAACKAKEPS